MKQGKASLIELAQALEDEHARKLDFVADTRHAHLSLTDTGPMLDVEDVGEFAVRPFAARQICSRLKVPARLYDLLEQGTARERAALEEVIAARWHEHPEARMFRAFAPDGGQPGVLRACLSDRYRRMDSLDLLMNVLPVLQQAGELRVASCEVTERRMYLKVVFPDIVAEPVIGDVVRAALCISTSEVGSGACRVENMVERKICANGLIVGTALNRFHIGRRQDAGVLDVLSDEALAADDQALWLSVRDVVASALNRENFDAAVDALNESTRKPVENVPGAVEVLGQKLKLDEEERQGVLAELIKGDPLLDKHSLRATQYGLIQAVTSFSQRDSVSYQRASEIEGLAGDLLHMPAREWRAVAKAA